MDCHLKNLFHLMTQNIATVLNFHYFIYCYCPWSSLPHVTVRMLNFWIFIADPPIVTLRLGSTLIVDDIKEMDDIYFECDIKANPPWRKLSWLHDVSDDARLTGRGRLWWITLHINKSSLIRKLNSFSSVLRSVCGFEHQSSVQSIHPFILFL